MRRVCSILVLVVISVCFSESSAVLPNGPWTWGEYLCPSKEKGHGEYNMAITFRSAKCMVWGEVDHSLDYLLRPRDLGGGEGVTTLVSRSHHPCASQEILNPASSQLFGYAHCQATLDPVALPLAGGVQRDRKRKGNYAPKCRASYNVVFRKWTTRPYRVL